MSELKEGMRVLLVEDNRSNIMLVEVFLKQTGYVLDVAEDGLAALEMYRAQRYDAVLMDMQMPKMDGYQATGEIRRCEREQGRKPAVILALTANALVEDQQRSLAAGCDGHLCKPVKKKLLLETLQAIAQLNNFMRVP